MIKTVDVILEEAASTPITDKSEASKQTLDQAIQIALEQARACETEKKSSTECAVAWDIVEELQAERSHRLANTKQKSGFDIYCKEHPEAVECLIYDV